MNVCPPRRDCNTGGVGAKTIDGAFVRQARAEMVARNDLSGRGLARRLSDQMDGWFDSLGGELPPGWSLIATGGYAHGLLCPGSDIDVILLHPPRASDDLVREIASPIWYPMWDGGVKLSPAAHSVKSLMSLAAVELASATSLLRIRRLAGSEPEVAAVRSSALALWRGKPLQWLGKLKQVNEERWRQTGEVASLLEPDLKDGRGGLRDYDALRWALFVDRADITSAMEEPVEELASHADVLLATRCELHRITGRHANVLLLQDQDALAAAMGYADADILMARVAEAARSVDWASERFWSRVERLIRAKGRRPALAGRVAATLAPGVTVVDDEVEVDVDIAGDDSSLILRVAAEAAHAGYPISRSALLSLSGSATEIPDVWPERTKRALLSLLGAGPQLVPAIDALERYELFSRMLPEWRHVRSLPQRNAFHTYTVDRHLLQTVVNANAFVRDVARPDLLLISALLHDIGKGYPGDHTEVGMSIVDRVGPRLGFSVDDVAIIRSMVEHHLLLAETATRRDLVDPRTIENTAAVLGDSLRLGLLRALTEADSLATGPSAWSSWKESLIDELTFAVEALFTGAIPEARSVLPEDRFADLLAMVRADRHLHARHERVGDFDQWFVASPDQRGLFAKIAGTFAVHGIDVVSAEAWTSADGIAVDQFQVPYSDAISRDWGRIEHDLRGVAAGTIDIESKLAQRIRTYSRAHRRALSASQPRFEVIISNDASASTTMIDVRAPDAIAVLYRLASSLAAQGLDIKSAKVATLGHEVVDVFYVQRSGHANSAGQVPLLGHDQLRSDLKAALNVD